MAFLDVLRAGANSGTGNPSAKERAKNRARNLGELGERQLFSLETDVKDVQNRAQGGVFDAADEFAARARQLTNLPFFQRSQGAIESGLDDYTGRVSGLYTSPGYTPAEQAGMRFATAAPIAAASSEALGDLQRQAAITNNPAALAAGRGFLARQRGQMTSQALAELAERFANARRADQQAAIGLSQFPIQQYQQVTAGERGMLPQFQFPAILNEELLSRAIQARLQGAGLAGGTAAGLDAFANQPGLWSRLFESAANRGLGALIPQRTV